MKSARNGNVIVIVDAIIKVVIVVIVVNITVTKKTHEEYDGFCTLRTQR